MAVLLNSYVCGWRVVVSATGKRRRQRLLGETRWRAGRRPRTSSSVVVCSPVPLPTALSSFRANEGAECRRRGSSGASFGVQPSTVTWSRCRLVFACRVRRQSSTSRCRGGPSASAVRAAGGCSRVEHLPTSGRFVGYSEYWRSEIGTSTWSASRRLDPRPDERCSVVWCRYTRFRVSLHLCHSVFLVWRDRNRELPTWNRCLLKHRS